MKAGTGPVSEALWNTLLQPLKGLGANAGANGWAIRQINASESPAAGFEFALRGMLLSLAVYADSHASRYESKLGDDGVLGREWKDALLGVRGLLNGELGRFDGGTLDKAICAMAHAAGIELE